MPRHLNGYCAIPGEVASGYIAKIECKIYSDSKEYVPGKDIVQKK